PKVRNDLETVANLWLSVPHSPSPFTFRARFQGARETQTQADEPKGRVQLKQVADVFLSDGRFLIAHEGGTRRRQVTCNVAGRDLESFAREAEKRLKLLPLPVGVHYAVTGEYEAKRATERELLL